MFYLFFFNSLFSRIQRHVDAFCYLPASLIHILRLLLGQSCLYTFHIEVHRCYHDSQHSDLPCQLSGRDSRQNSSDPLCRYTHNLHKNRMVDSDITVKHTELMRGYPWNYNFDFVVVSLVLT